MTLTKLFEFLDFSQSITQSAKSGYSLILSPSLRTSFINHPSPGGVAAALELPGLDIVLRRVVSEHLQQTMVLPNSVSASLVKLAEGEDLSDLIG